MFSITAGSPELVEVPPPVKWLNLIFLGSTPSSKEELMCLVDWFKPVAGECAENIVHEHISLFLNLLACLGSPYPMVVAF